jgi:parvulin-like peptidyl-prolyl isomerase
MTRLAVIAGLHAALFLAGCAKDEATALDREAFYRPPPGTRADRHVLTDQPGQLNYDNVRMDLLAPPDQQVGVLNIGKDDAPPRRESVTDVPESVRENVQFPTAAGAVNGATAMATPTTTTTRTPPATRPATAPAPAPAPARTGVSSGVAMTIGSVVCEVNGTPIYADKVLKSLSRVFAAEAKRRNEREFRKFAAAEIEKQVTLFVEEELAFAAAKKNLDAREQAAAQDRTMAWRARQITQAGGSVERARAKAAAEGLNFDEMVDAQNRLHMVQIYYTKRLMPRAQVRADDMRRYYNQNVDKLFTDVAQAQFRVIRIDAAKTGGADPAREKIENLRARATRGEDFAELARTVNDDPHLMRQAGDVGWVQRGAFAVEPVEEAVWKLSEPGQVTDVVRVGDAFYIARLESRKPGRVRPFEEDAVQEQITKALQGEMLQSLRAREREMLMRDAIVYPYPPLYNVVLDMAMQKYPEWAASADAR